MAEAKQDNVRRSYLQGDPELSSQLLTSPGLKGREWGSVWDRGEIQTQHPVMSVSSSPFPPAFASGFWAVVFSALFPVTIDMFAFCLLKLFWSTELALLQKDSQCCYGFITWVPLYQQFSGVERDGR